MLKYELEQKKFSELKNNIEIPKFQRGLVWNEDKKKEFIKLVEGMSDAQLERLEQILALVERTDV